MSEILKKKLPTDLVRLIQSYLMPSIFDTHASKILLNDEIDELYTYCPVIFLWI